MYKLLLDSSDTNLSIGIANEEKILYTYSTYAWQRQSEYMIPEIEKALNATHITLKDINVVALGIGPGSYTGVRIPLAIAKTLNTANNVDIIALSSLAIMGTTEENYVALMNARSNRSYIGVYSQGKAVIKDQIIENDKLDDFIAPYLDKGYALKGNLEYLEKDIKVNEAVINGLFTYSLITPKEENPKALCPVYLKD